MIWSARPEYSNIRTNAVVRPRSGIDSCDASATDGLLGADAAADGNGDIDVARELGGRGQIGLSGLRWRSKEDGAMRLSIVWHTERVEGTLQGPARARVRGGEGYMHRWEVLLRGY